MLGVVENKTQMVDRIKKNSSVYLLIEAYLCSKQYVSLSAHSQREYESCLRIASNTKIHTGKTLGATAIMNVSLRHATECYDQWLDRGIYTANKIASTCSVLFNWAMRRELLMRNPMIGISRVPNPPRKVMWTPEQVKLFLDTAYSEWKWRSVGLIVHTAYEWGQRIGDMRVLTWDKIDIEARRMDIEQSKRKADVHLPISEPLAYVLAQQKETFGFQPYVAPKMNASDNVFKPYSKVEFGRYVNQVKAAAGLPSNLTAMDMRRTAITEMVEAGVDIAQIKQVSGHKSLNSLTPYIRHTFAGASNALAQRNAYLKGKEDEQ
jgi:integrase